MNEPKLPGFDRTTFTHQGESRSVYRAGSGPAVVVIHEIPGLHPGVVEFGQTGGAVRDVAPGLRRRLRRRRDRFVARPRDDCRQR